MEVSSEPGLWELNTMRPAETWEGQCRMCKIKEEIVEYREAPNLLAVQKQMVLTLSLIAGDPNDLKGLTFHGINKGKV